MKKMSLALGAMMMCAAAASADEPIITFKTNIYDTYGATNSFHFRLGATTTDYFDVDCGYGTVEYEIEPASFDQDSQEIVATSVTCQVGPEGIVKIYGDASLIDYFDGEGCYIDWIEFGDCTNLEIVDLQHNELKRLDLSKYTKLSAIYLTDNTFTEATPLVIGTDHPNLAILEIDIVDYISPDFDITTYPNLVSFDAYANKTLTHLDPTKCPNLMRLSLDSCPIKSIDVTKNPLLSVLNVEDSGISELDLSQNPKLSQLYITHMSGSLNQVSKFKSIDLSNNPELRYLAAGGNALTSIDLSKNPNLDFIILAYNNLTSLDVSANSLISTLDIRYNNMDFATLPLPNSSWYDYEYQQQPLAVDRSYAVGTELDFSSKVLREGTTTDAVLYSFNVVSGEASPLDASYYDFTDGKLTLLKECQDSVYVSFGNTAFPEANLLTGRFRVKSAAEFGQPTAAVNFTTSVADGQPVQMMLGLSGATEATPKTVYVDFGNGVRQEYTVTTDALGSAPNVSGLKKEYGSVVIYVPEGEVLTAFGTDGVPMYSIDVTAATELRQLVAKGAGLYSVDLSYNRCLTKLDLSDNNFSTFSLAGINGNYGKNVLSDIDLSGNRLYEVELNDTRTITRLDLSDNQFVEFDYKEFEYMLDFDISGNKLSTINLAYFTAAKNVNLSNNDLVEIQMPETYVMENFDLRGNKFTIATLPYCPSIANYDYAPQAEIVLPSKGPGADLSAQNREIDGVGTTFTWKKADGTVLTAEQVEDNGGKARFIATDLGEIYCDMANPAFPKFSGDTPFRTTLIEAAAMPTNVIAEFTTPVGGESVSLLLTAVKNGTAVYIDWAGEGYDLEQYLLTTTYTLYEATTVAGANVKVYTYSDDDKLSVFSMTGATLSSMDASRLTDLICLSVNGAGLTDDQIKYPQTANIEELYLDDNALEAVPFADYPRLRSLSLNDNALTSLDLSANQALQLVAAGNNEIANVVMDNPDLWFLDLSGNMLETIDLSKVGAMEQMALSHNSLSTIDVSGMSRLRQLLIDHNKFTFATLPAAKSTYYQYVYADQAAMEAECIDGSVDLSSQAMVGSVPTTYRWFIDMPEFDDYGELSGEELEAGEEYTVEDGVTTFVKAFSDVVCVMTNTSFPSLYLYTNMIKSTGGIADAAYGADEFAVRLDGRDIYVTASVEDGTPVRLISLDGRTVAASTISDGVAVLRSVSPGVAVIAVGNRAAKVAVR